jgi:hypothetical protein
VEKSFGPDTEYFDIKSDFSAEQINEEDLVEMDCITCHNRISHLVSYPEEIIDALMKKDLISSDIPGIRQIGLETYYKEYTSLETALAAFDLLDSYYQEKFPDYYIQNINKISQAIQELKTSYTNTVYPQQKSDWSSHPDNIGHEYSPGCFRCHDGEHLSADEEAIRLECNLCHSIPVVSEAGNFLTVIELGTGPEPESHLNTNWISLHHLVYEPSCGNCHTLEDPGGVSNTSFCSNSACHGVSWDYAGFDAPTLRESILDQLPTPQPSPTPAPELEDPEEINYTNVIRGVLINRCAFCHGEGGQAGLNFNTYSKLMAGNDNGLVIIPGDPESSLLLLKTEGEGSHFAQFTSQELELIKVWIESGAQEN